uniref:Uncharacterized protein n=1 Tax=Timema bartmani TaxID=61472 RepID=A0A7R9I311_9NEOP|nr:unnamed protein product [Timema bartmani]
MKINTFMSDLRTNVMDSNTASASTTFIQGTSNNVNKSGIQRVERLRGNFSLTKVVLSVIWKKGVLGAAYYSVETSEVYVFLDIVDVQPEFNMLKSLFYQVHPTKVVTCGSLAERFISTVKLLANYEDSDEESSSGANNMLPQRRLHFMPGKECRIKVISLGKVPHICEGRVENHYEDGKKTTLSTPDQDSNLNLPVIGSLVYYESSAENTSLQHNGYIGQTELNEGARVRTSRTPRGARFDPERRSRQTVIFLAVLRLVGYCMPIPKLIWDLQILVSTTREQGPGSRQDVT